MIDLTNPRSRFHLFRLADKRREERTGLICCESKSQAALQFARLHGLKLERVETRYGFSLASGGDQ